MLNVDFLEGGGGRLPSSLDEEESEDEITLLLDVPRM